MIDELRALQAAARSLEPGAAQRDELLRPVLAYAHRFLEGIAGAPAYAPHGMGSVLPMIGEDGTSIGELLALLSEHVDSVGINPTSGRFLGYIPAGGLFPAALGDYLAAVTNRYSGYFFSAPGAVRIENLLLRWMASVVGYPEAAVGNLTPGGSLANLSAIVTARDDRGIAGAKISRSVVYVTSQTHHCIQKALHYAGLDACIKRHVAVDAGFRMRPPALAEIVAEDRRAGLHPWLLVATAGSTNAGAVDPLEKLARIATDEGLWLHVDGAYGAGFALCPEGREVLRGLERADSLVMDPHKTLFLPYGIGAVLVKDGKKLYASNTWQADYVQDLPERSDELSPSDLSPELTRHFRGLRMWLPLKLFGVAPFRAALSEKIRLARYFHDRLKAVESFDLCTYPDLSIVTFRYLPPNGDPDLLNRRLLESLQQAGRIFLSSTRLDGRFVLRLAIGCVRTHLEEIDEALDAITQCARRL